MAGCLDQLAHEDLQIPFPKGGLCISDILTHAQFLLAKQACHAWWSRAPCSSPCILDWPTPVGVHVSLPLIMASTPRTSFLPTRTFSILLFEVFGLRRIAAQQPQRGHLQSSLHGAYHSPLSPCPKVEDRLPNLPWRIAWCALPTTYSPAWPPMSFSLFFITFSQSRSAATVCVLPLTSLPSLPWSGGGCPSIFFPPARVLLPPGPFSPSVLPHWQAAQSGMPSSILHVSC